ncbi:hypothetical protein BASA50_005588 [Batrachochytrium salamandrivorans]|uniref:Reverse transcriptase domain-containing protein n=1 Tax=Batrachochytrium salamandrivorans TaxID=1357716 RepID=A0ABQ8FCN3_9FUNG|nr:hypothetical protein BASA50_005588 [Batrachochytrium salamandrivorans]
MGFPRRTLAFLKALYTSSSSRARAGSLLSDPFPVQRGVRQGCPLSGLLFNLFINDILDGVAPIIVPGLPRDTDPIRGLMYADDVAVFADSEQSLLAASTAVEQWANRWEMQFGVAKCGIISFTGPADNDQQGNPTVHWCPTFDCHWTPSDNDVFTLNVQGQLVRSQRWFWSRRTKQLYRNRYWLTPQVRPKTVKQRHSFALMETLRTCGDSASLQNSYSAHPFAHLVVECEQVTGHRIQSGLVPAIQKSRLRLLGRALDPGVENVYTWLRGGVLNGEVDLGQRWLDETVEHESMGTRHDNRAVGSTVS